ncbi:uncharacterized protein EI90DRAFT_3085299 [Cantharellus anzutake]|uniref:uncharacterized protein n=1 Tax=Cantharellus anzutake TaxID=1750568 RepID=UPI001908B4E8|nr:uncharacterized protein EI90DRAFT_3091538 [Cantharellus anzutake]XP_038909443.1 uncharacterized protein EI90DRAFT_3085299 [Cantharellus anzutake]KAF8313724.1 hypothetical protein EI90DRAFT_3091538 [Cantharellus anzutake]KAF8317298.1 hypothetical protein EI90DRAFT_3085299 [Cantharellus anzutake]
MRFWNALVPIALVPVVVADFHYTTAGCFDHMGVPTIPSFLALLPSNQDSCDDATNPKSLFYQLQNGQVTYNNQLTTLLCGANITVEYLDPPIWSSSDGGHGRCYGLSGGVKSENCTNHANLKGYCSLRDAGFCDSYLCK